MLIGMLRRRATARRAAATAAGRTVDATGRTDVADAHLAMVLTQESIAGADGKASVLGTGAAVVVGLVASSLDLRGLGASSGETLGAVLGLLALALLLVTGVELAGVLVPRVRADRSSRYAWPAIVDVPLEELVDARPETDREEAWAQAQMLARIAARKHVHLRRAMVWFGATVVLVTAWALVTSAVR